MNSRLQNRVKAERANRFVATNSLAGKSYNQLTGDFVDTELDRLNKKINILKAQLTDTQILSDITEIGITKGSETAEDISRNMPSNSILIYHKHGEAVSFYPERTGLLVIVKGLDNSRVKFTYSGFGYEYYGFYDAYRGTNVDLWTGWTKVGTGTGGGTTPSDTITTNRLLTNYLSNTGGEPIMMEVSLQGNNKNLGQESSPFQQVRATYGYFDHLEVGGKVITG